MRSKTFFATLMIGLMLVAATVSIDVQAATGRSHMSKNPTTHARRTTKRMKKGKVKKASSDVARGTKDTGKMIGNGGEKAGEGVAEGSEVAAKATVTGAKDARKSTAKGVRKAGKATASAGRKVGRAFKKL